MLEVICESVTDAIESERGGAYCVEVVSNLVLGGLTPPLDVVQSIRDAIQIEMHVMVRPHARSFVYDTRDIESIFNTVEQLKKIGVTGIVFGALKPDSTADINLLKQIRETAKDLSLTFHRAIDSSANPNETFGQVRSYADRVLSSGGAKTVWEGRNRLRQWATNKPNDLILMCGGGLRYDDIEKAARYIGADGYHVGTAARHNGQVLSSKVNTLIKAVERGKAPPP